MADKINFPGLKEVILKDHKLSDIDIIIKYKIKRNKNIIT